MIRSIEITGFKSIRYAHITLQPINILIGANGSGKSNFVSFFEFLDYLNNARLQEYVGLRGGIEKFLYKGLTPSEELSCAIDYTDGTYLYAQPYSFTIVPSSDSFVFSKETIWYNEKPLERFPFQKEAFLKDYKNIPGSDYQVDNKGHYIVGSLRGYKKYHFHNTGMNSPFNLTTHIEKDSIVLYEKGENLAPMLYKIRKYDTKVYSRIVKTIQSIAPYFSDFVLAPNEAGYLKLYWQDKFSAYNYGVTDLSDGTIRFIALAVLFMQPNLPGTIILDEPELGLHPTAIGKLAGMISSAVGRGSQVIIAAQSADLISYFQPEDVVAVDQKDGCSIFNRLKREDYRLWLEEYSLGDLWQRNIINKGQPFETL